jgi:hypothetical protein
MKRSSCNFIAGWMIFLFFMVIGSAIGSICWPYTINHWLIFTHHTASVTWWQGALIGFVPWIGHLAIPAAIVTWILSLFVG